MQGIEPITITHITPPSRGVLDSGITFNNGVLSGMPENGRDYGLTFRATNAQGSADTTFSLPIQAVGDIVAQDPINLTYIKGIAKSVDLTQYLENVDRMSRTGGIVPAGLGLSNNGLFVFGTVADSVLDGRHPIMIRFLHTPALLHLEKTRHTLPAATTAPAACHKH